MKRRGLRAGILALVSALCISTAAMSTAVGDERDQWEQKQEKAQNDRRLLQEQLAGLDDNLKQVYLKLADVREQIPQAKADLGQAQDRFAAAQREYELVTDQLNAAVSEKERIDGEIAEVSAESERTRSDIAMLVREVYRSGDIYSSPLILAMTSKSTTDLTQRASGAQTMAVAQSRAVSAAQESLAVERNQLARQEALTKRITKLHEQAESAKVTAEAAKIEASDKLLQLEDLEKAESDRAAEVEKVQAKAKQQLQKAEQNFAQARANIARIDEENRRKQIAWEQAQAAKKPAAPARPAPAPNAGGGSAVTTSGVFGYPLPRAYPVTSGFGYRWHPILGIWRLHSGVDYGAPCGTPALATANGVVSEISYGPSAGNYVTLNYGMISGSSYQSMYLHLQGAAVSVGQRVSRGQVIGYVGTTGGSTGCHLHYEFIINGRAVDARNYM